MLKLRDYQDAALDMLREAFKDGHKAILLYLATGGGKTEIAIAMLEACRVKGTRAAMLLDRIVLCDQTSQRLDKYKIDHGVLQSGHWRYRPHELIQVCSAQTIEKRGSFPGLSLLIIDEAHNSRASTLEFIKNNPHVKVIGLTATPFTKGLGATYSHVVSPITTKKLVDAGSLVPLRVFVAKEIDMEGAKKVAGEWSQDEVTSRGKKITGDIVAEWVKKTHEIFGKPEKTIVFCAGVDHGIDLQQKFQEQGYNFVSISYRDDNDFKRDIIDDFNKPDSDIVGLIATDILTKGFDSPAVRIGVSARPFSKSLSSHIQQMGRVMRTYPGKTFGVWLCLAKGSKVLTHIGLVPIDKVTSTHKIWDGTNFVTHGGAVCNGIQKVITYQGLTATPGHLVHTSEGWRTFGDCAAQQIRITQTGLGGETVRIGENLRPTSFLAGREASKVYSRFVRVRDLWLQKLNFPCQSPEREDKGMQSLQSAGYYVSNVAVQQSASHEVKMRQQKQQSLSSVRRAWDRIQVFWGQRSYALDHAKPRFARVQNGGGAFTHSVGQDKSKWTLRTGQPSLDFCGTEPAKQKGQSVRCSDTQVQDGSSRNSILRQHIEAFLLGWNDGRRNSGEISQTICKAEREVWDILDAGPHNRFTCEGLLVHNCHSGNYLRFREDWEDVFENGVSELEDGKEKTKKEPTEKEKKEAKCPACGALWPRGSDTCAHCGHVRERKSMVQSVPGEMQELGAMSREDKQKWWSMGQYMVQSGSWAEGRAKAVYKSKFGVWPNGLHSQPLPPSREFERFARKSLIAYLKGKR